MYEYRIFRDASTQFPSVLSGFTFESHAEARRAAIQFIGNAAEGTAYTFEIHPLRGPSDA